MAEQTNPYGDFGALNEALLNKISGGQGKLINQYLDAALPMPEETNNWMPVYEFFRQMTENASKPGATVFGSAAQATSAPMDYLNAKKAEARKTQQARAALGLQIAPSLKPKAKTGAGTAVKVVDEEGNVKFMSTAQAIKTGATPYIAPPAGSKASLVKKDYTVTKLGGIEVSGINIPQDTVVQFTDTERNLFGPTDLGPYEKPSTATDTGQTFEFTSPEAAAAWSLNNPDYTLTEDMKLGKTSIFLPKSMGLVPANSGLLKESRKESDPESVLKNFRTFYTKDAAYTAYTDLKSNMDAVITSYEGAYTLERPGVADISMIFAYMKMLDPRSVVREGEQAQASNSGGVPDAVRNIYNSLLDGGKLQDPQRRSFLNQAHALYKRKSSGLISLNERFSSEAQTRNIKTRFDGYMLSPEEYSIRYFGQYPGDSAIETKVGTEGLNELAIIAQYENITEPQIAKIRQQIAAIRSQLGLPPSND